jgi:hypothetical protein
MSDMTASYNQLSAQYQAARTAEDAAWGRLAGLAGIEPRYAELKGAASEATRVRRELSAQLDAAISAETAAAAALAARIGAALHPAGCQCSACTGDDLTWAATADDDDPRWVAEAGRNTDRRYA